MHDTCSRTKATTRKMNAKSLVVGVTFSWFALCWYWYVCGIKEACGDRMAVAAAQAEKAIQPAQTMPAPAPATPDPAIQPVDPQPATSKPYDASDIEKAQVERVSGKIIIHFPYNSTRKEDNAAIDAELSSLAVQLAQSTQKVRITGHTDFVGDAAANKKFGQLRAEGIKKILVQKGVSAARIQCSSLGDTRPVATNDNAWGRYQNRRVEITVK